jgi:hypothetical protein
VAATALAFPAAIFALDCPERPVRHPEVFSSGMGPNGTGRTRTRCTAPLDSMLLDWLQRQ